MWMTQQLTARILVWMAAVAIPLQGWPTTGCGCAGGKVSSDQTCQKQHCRDCSRSAPDNEPGDCCNQQVANRCCSTEAKVCRCGETSPCPPHSSPCCSGNRTTGNCCSSSDMTASAGSSGSECQCGSDCRCGNGKVPPEPAAPPAETSSPERMIADSAGAASSGAIYLPSMTRPRLDLEVGTDALSAHDCCVTLCRFTL
jgi:hypothetical protein